MINTFMHCHAMSVMHPMIYFRCVDTFFKTIRGVHKVCMHLGGVRPKAYWCVWGGCQTQKVHMQKKKNIEQKLDYYLYYEKLNQKLAIFYI